ncbi:glutathione gamma-glutamylcysteinyltransferase 3-like isoform X1 [Cucurbita moschata]|uniref:glutathione gamma-glutamylcysteinyltransferase n=2 Tax=Cucurbita moschata TaxID=3662 RepID=A0A6J1GQY9_CUCMO|nr:glutathione gamma-glutamylcysteinyltransferase 3-like isoform X1 [Cucurbita moschata]
MAVAGFYRRVLPSPPAIDFSSSDGKRLFTEALGDGTMEGFFKLISYYQTQSEPAFCGLATLAVVLNALSIDPGRKWKGPWRWFDDTMLDCCEPLAKIKTDGITFGKVACLARCNGAKVVAFRANESTINDFRKYVVSCSSSEDCHVITSYHRGAFKQTGSGHFSPIGGYHTGKDMVLILDVARFKYPPHWVPLTLLWDAMNTIDSATGLPRGYMILSKLPRGPSILYTLSCQHDGWNSVIKYLTEEIPQLLKAEDVKDVRGLLSVVFKMPPPNLRQFIKWVAEVREKEDGNVKLNAEERGRLAVKEEILEQLRATELFKHVKQWLASETLCKGLTSSFDKDELHAIAASVCCQGAETLGGKRCSADRSCCKTDIHLLNGENEKAAVVVAGSVVSNVSTKQGVDMLVPLCKTDECCCEWPSVVDVLTILLLSLPQHIWSTVKEEKLLADINTLVAEKNLPALLQDEVLHLRQQMHLLMTDLGSQ